MRQQTLKETPLWRKSFCSDWTRRGKPERAAGVETFEESRQPPDARKRSGQIALFEIEG